MIQRRPQTTHCGAILATFGVLAISLSISSSALAGWSRPAQLSPRGGEVGELAEIAVNSSGNSIASWEDARNRVWAAVGNRRGRFSHIKRLGRGSIPIVEIANNGRATVYWSNRRGDVSANYVPGRGYSKPKRTREPDPDELAKASLTKVNPNTDKEQDVLSLSVRSPGGAFGPSQQIAVGRLSEPTVAVNRAGAVAVAWTDVVACSGNVGECFGRPNVAVRLPSGEITARTQAQLSDTDARRSFNVSVVLTGAGKTLLFWQQKQRSATYSLDAPVHALLAGDSRAFKLTNSDAANPVTANIGETRALTVWKATGSSSRSFDSAIYAADTGFRSAGAPSEHLRGRQFIDAFDLDASGRYAAMIWTTATTPRSRYGEVVINQVKASIVKF